MMDLDALERLLAAATPRPWLWEYYVLLSPGLTRKGDGSPKRCRSRDRKVISIEPDGACGDPECCPQGVHLEVSRADADLIAALRNAAPALVAQARAARLAREALRAVRGDCGDCVDGMVDGMNNDPDQPRYCNCVFGRVRRALAALDEACGEKP